MIVDYQSHWYPRAYFERLVGRDRYPRATRTDDGGYFYGISPGGYAANVLPHYVDLELQLADMDAHGVDVAVLTANLIGEVAELDVSEACETLEFINEEFARAQREQPERIIGTAMLPMQDADAAVATLDRAVTELGLQAVCILSNTGGRPVVTDATLPIYRRIDELGVPIILHPANQSLVSGLGFSAVIEVGAAWVFDTTAAALSFVYSGTLDACPNLTILHPHLGGTIPYIAGRVALCQTFDSVETERPLEAYLRERFFIDSVGDTPGALPLAIETYGLDRILYGTDYPWLDRSKGRRFVETALDEDQANTVLHDNYLPGIAIPTRTSD